MVKVIMRKTDDHCETGIVTLHNTTRQKTLAAHMLSNRKLSGRKKTYSHNYSLEIVES